MHTYSHAYITNGRYLPVTCLPPRAYRCALPFWVQFGLAGFSYVIKGWKYDLNSGPATYSLEYSPDAPIGQRFRRTSPICEYPGGW